jgi:transcriptional regulator with XRE-family HTH domain
MATIDLKALLGMAIKTQRTSLGISQEELAYRAGLHRTYVSDLERGARNPSIESIEKLAGAFQVSVSKLFESVGKGTSSRQMVEILLVEDDPRDVDLTVRALKKAHITNPLQIARDGEEALDFVFANAQVLRRVKADKRTQDIPVIILTASTRNRDIAKCRRLGAENYIVKPVGFHNFSEVTPRLSLAWMLIKQNADMPAGT